MKKLFNLKKWLTLQEAAKYLSLLFNEDVSEADVLRLGLDGHLTLSVYFVNHTQGRITHITPITEAKKYIVPSTTDLPPRMIEEQCKLLEVMDLPDDIQKGIKDGSLTMVLAGTVINKNEVLQHDYDDSITSLSGIWDLPMIGGERLDVEHMYQQLTDGPEVTLTCLDGAFVKRPDGRYANLQMSFDDNEHQPGSLARLKDIKEFITTNNIDPKKAQSLIEQHEEDRKIFLEKAKQRPDIENYHPSDTLPKDSVIVVRTDNLRAFEESMSDNPAESDKPLQPTERNSLLTIIATLCDYVSINPTERGAAGKIAKLTERFGAPVSDDTIGRVLKKIPDAVESRKK